METLQPWAPMVAVAGAVLGFLGAVGWFVLFRRFERFARPYEELANAAAAEGVSTALQSQLLGVERNAARIEEAWAYAQRLETQLHTTLQGVGFLKYDAFEDIRGSQSYSLCLLDAHQNGVVITSIAGRNDYRGYGKPVKNGHCDLAMSDEEKRSLEIAKESLSKSVLHPKSATDAAAKPKAEKSGDKKVTQAANA